MLRRFFRQLSERIPVQRSRRLTGLEPLEGRAVLSVCGVTCALDSGLLDIKGTAGDDQIAIRYDAATASLSVLGRGDELIGQYSLEGVRQLNVEGLAGNDQFEVDPRLRLNIQLNGGEGVDALVGSGPHIHDPGGASTFQQVSVEKSLPFTASSLLFGGGSTSTTGLATLLSSGSSSASALQLTQAAFFAGDHSSHSSASGDNLLSSAGEHVHEMGTLAGAVAGTLLTHSHSSGDRNSWITSPAKAGSEDSSDLSLGSHDQHVGNNGVTASPAKLVNKPCTVSYTGGLVVTAVDGKRECGCEDKKAAAEAIAKELHENGGAPFAGSLKLAVDCVPCQRSLLDGLPTELKACALTPAEAIDLVLPEFAVHGDGCPDRSAVAGESAESPWLEGLQFAGWSLLTASVILAPTLWNKEDKEDEADERAQPTDWFFSRWGGGLLSAR